MQEAFSEQELTCNIRKLKNGKAQGPDIMNEMIKHLGTKARATMLDVFNRSWNQGTVPTVWKEAIIVPIPKKGKDQKKKPQNYRPINLLSCIGKLLERMVNNRLQTYLEQNNLLSPTQTGFRQHRATTDILHPKCRKWLPRKEKDCCCIL